MSKKIIYGSDYRGIKLKENLLIDAKSRKHLFQDIGINTGSLLDYVDIAKEIAEEIYLQSDAVGIAICRKGFGLAIALNRFSHIRACVCSSIEDALFARKKLDANVVCLGADSVNSDVACEIVETFISTPFLEGKHIHCVEKVSKKDQDSTLGMYTMPLLKVIIRFENKILLQYHVEKNDEMMSDNKYILPYTEMTSKKNFLESLNILFKDELRLPLNSLKFFGTFEEKIVINHNEYSVLNQIFVVKITANREPKINFIAKKKLHSVWCSIAHFKANNFFPKNLQECIIESLNHEDNSIKFKSDFGSIEQFL